MRPLHLLILLVLVAFASAGCYTLLSHPESSGYVEEDRGGDSYYRDCRDCHEDADYYHSSFRWSGYRYSQRYYNPWWYDDYWYYDPYYPGGWWWPHDGGDGGHGGSDAPLGSWGGSRREKGDGQPPLIHQIPNSAPAPAQSGQGSPNQVQENAADNDDDPEAAEPKKEEERPKQRRQKR